MKKLKQERANYKKKNEWSRTDEISFQNAVVPLLKMDFETLIRDCTKKKKEAEEEKEEISPLANFMYENFNEIFAPYLSEAKIKDLKENLNTQNLKWFFLNPLTRLYMDGIKGLKTVRSKITYDEIRCNQCSGIFSRSDMFLAQLKKKIKSLEECPICHSLDTFPDRKIVVEGIVPETTQEEVEKAAGFAFQEFQRIFPLDKKYRLPHNRERDFEWYKLWKKGMSIHQIAERELKNKQSRIKWENYIKRKTGTPLNGKLDKSPGSEWDLFTRLRSAGGKTPIEHLIENAVSRIRKEISKKE